MAENTQIKTLLWWMLVGLALLSYCLPWVHNAGISLSLNAYDLAEWATLHPAVRAASPSLVTSLLLRLPLPCLALAIVLSSLQNKGIKLILICITAVALLPPLEFFGGAFEDINYRQQFILAMATLLGGAIGLTGFSQQRRYKLAIALLAVGLLTTLIGVTQAYGLLVEFLLPVQYGIGSLAMMVASALMIIYEIKFSQITKNKTG